MKRTDFDVVQAFAQDFVHRVPVTILGSGASAAYGIPGMAELGNHLLDNVTPDASHEAVWGQFRDALPANGLEGALNIVTLPDELTAKIVKATRQFLIPPEISLLEQIMSGRTKLSLSRLFAHLLRTTHKEIHVVTSNYDRLAEFAADDGQFACRTGFSHGYIRHKTSDIRLYQGSNQIRTVCVWKVHGSMDWFATDTSQIVSIPALGECLPGLEPVMITPGISKYRRTHEEPFRTVMALADDALSNANSYLCIGYGFNDDHIQTKLIEKCRIAAPIVVLARTLSPAAKNILFAGGVKKFLALEKNDSGTVAYFNGNQDGCLIPDVNLWETEEFLDMTFGRA